MKLKIGNHPCPRELGCERNHDSCEAHSTPEGVHKAPPLPLGQLPGSWEPLSPDQGFLAWDFPWQLHSLPPSFGLDQGAKTERDSQTMFTEYCTCGDIIGELSCLLKREIEYTATCETILQVRPGPVCTAGSAVTSQAQKECQCVRFLSVLVSSWVPQPVAGKVHAACAIVAVGSAGTYL